jgi:hypothetical protein
LQREAFARERHLVHRHALLTQHGSTHAIRRQRNDLHFDALLGQTRHKRHEQERLQRFGNATRTDDVQHAKLATGSFGHDAI